MEFLKKNIKVSFRNVSGSKSLDLFPYVTRCTLDIILESAMGKSLDFQHNRHSDYAMCINDIVHMVQVWNL